MKTEVEYRAVPGMDDVRVGSDGSVLVGKRGKWRKPAIFLSTGGYPAFVKTTPGAKKRTHYVHRLVLMAFAGPCPSGHEARHLDGTRSNNSISNLAWGTHRENEADKLRYGVKQHRSGEWNPNSKLNEADVKEIRRRVTQGETHASVAKSFGIYTTAVGKIIRRERWAHVA